MFILEVYGEIILNGELGLDLFWAIFLSLGFITWSPSKP